LQQSKRGAVCEVPDDIECEVRKLWKIKKDELGT
jgi:hypothetical protein